MRVLYGNVHLLNIYIFSANLIFVLPVILLYYKDKIGLTFQDFLICEAVFAAIVVALEVPSGWLSDIWKRKYVLILSTVFWLAGFIVLLYADSFLDALIAQSILGVAISLQSGTDTALLYDTLLEDGRADHYVRLDGKRQGLGLYANALSALAGGFLYAVNPDFTIWLTLAAGGVALVAVAFLQEPGRHKSAIQGHPFRDIAQTLTLTFRGNRELGFIVLAATALFASTKLIMWVQQPYYVALNVPEIWFGVLMAVGFAFGGLGSHMAHRLNIRTPRLLGIFMIWAIIVCLLSAFVIGYHGIALLIVGASALFGLGIPRIRDAVNKRVSSDRRATVLSSVSFMREIVFIPLSFFIGWLSGLGGVSLALFGIAAWLVISGGVLGLWRISNQAKDKYLKRT